MNNTGIIYKAKLTKKKSWYGIISQFPTTQWGTTIQFLMMNSSLKCLEHT
jgi:hypothetical protein